MAREPLKVLTESMFYVLLSLLRQERCGTEIVRYVDDATAGRVPLGPGTLYTILAKFQEEGLIREAAVEGRKRTYAITERGRALFPAGALPPAPLRGRWRAGGAGVGAAAAGDERGGTVKKRFLMPEAYWDTALLERWLEEKAVQGWRPVSFSRYGSGKFEPAEPRKLRYRLEPLRTETYDAQCEREETYREMGWEPAGVLGDYRVYACAEPIGAGAVYRSLCPVSDLGEAAAAVPAT